MNKILIHFYSIPLSLIYILSLLAFLSALVLLLLGQLVTSFRVGMADPIWPTEPWYLFINYRLDFGYFIEHMHRIIGFVVGGLVALLTIIIWYTEQRSIYRWTGFLGLIISFYGFGNFHRELISQRDLTPAETLIPFRSMGITVVGFCILYSITINSLTAGCRYSILRLIGISALLAIMIQGLLGGFRVFFNELFGTDLAIIHGIFAHVVLGILSFLVALTHPMLTNSLCTYSTRNQCSPLLVKVSIFCTISLYIQVIFGVLVRHDPIPLTQKLHFLTAFLVSFFLFWLLFIIYSSPSVRLFLDNRLLVVLIFLLICQLVLGVEAWMEKFGSYTLPELVPVTKWNATVRTLHSLIGSVILAKIVMITVWLYSIAHPFYSSQVQVKDQV